MKKTNKEYWMIPYAKVIHPILKGIKQRILKTSPKEKLAADIAVAFAISICIELLVRLKEADLLVQPDENKRSQVSMKNYQKAQKGQELIKTFLSN